MNKQTAIALFSSLLLVILYSLVEARENYLVLTADEFEANLTYNERGVDIFRKPTDPLAPQILIERPDLDSDVIPPVGFSVRFEPSSGSAIDLESLKVRYGWFDITERVLQSMDVSPTGITGEIRSARKGRYALRLSIRDTQGRSSEAKIRFHVTEGPKDIKASS